MPVPVRQQILELLPSAEAFDLSWSRSADALESRVKESFLSSEHLSCGSRSPSGWVSGFFITAVARVGSRSLTEQYIKLDRNLSHMY